MNKFPLIVVLLIVGLFLMFGCTSTPSVAIAEGSVTVVDVNGFMHAVKLSDLNDVYVVGVVPGNVLSWNGTQWIAKDVNGGGGGPGSDTNWQTSFGIFDANMKATYALIGSGGSNIDTNWVTSWAIFDVNMKYYYALKSDINNWAHQLDIGMQSDSNKWSLTKLDANALYQLKGNYALVGANLSTFTNDVPFLTGASLISYLTKADANGFFVLKTDLNSDINAVITLYNYYSRADINASFLSKVDGNKFYPLKSDSNIWTNQLIFLSQTDSNKWILTKLDANGFYVLKTDLNGDINAVIALYNYYNRTDINASFLSKIDANGFYILKGSITDTNWQTSWAIFDSNMRTTYKLPWIDTNWQTSWSILDTNLKATYYLSTNPSGFISSYIDTNWQTSWGLLDVNLKATYALLGSGGTDTNWQTSWASFDTNMKNTYRYYAVDLNTSANVHGTQVIADNNFLLGPKGYIYDDGNSIVIGRSA